MASPLRGCRRSIAFIAVAVIGVTRAAYVDAVATQRATAPACARLAFRPDCPRHSAAVRWRRATGDGLVLVEIEMNGHADPPGYRIVGPATGFDSAALDATRTWRVDAPEAREAADLPFVYAVVGFRSHPRPDRRADCQ